MGIRRGPSIVKNGLVLCLDAALPKSYPLSGNTWYDLSGSGNDGTINGATFDTNSRGVFDFNGSSNYVNCGNLNFSSSFSLSCWIRVDSGTSSIYTKGLVSKYNTNGNYRQYTLGFNESNNYINFGLSTDGTGSGATGSFVQSSNNSISRSTWYHICGVFTSGSKVELFINGELTNSLNTIATSHFQSNIKPLEIGSSEASDGIATRFFNGQIAQVSTYNEPLSSYEVKQNYEATRGRFESYSPCDIGVTQTTTTTTSTTTTTTSTTTTTTTTTTAAPTTTTTTTTTLDPSKYYCYENLNDANDRFCANGAVYAIYTAIGGPYDTESECLAGCEGASTSTTTSTTSTTTSTTSSPTTSAP
jgi:hypothetical protein